MQDPLELTPLPSNLQSSITNLACPFIVSEPSAFDAKLHELKMKSFEDKLTGAEFPLFRFVNRQSTNLVGLNLSSCVALESAAGKCD